MKKTATARKVTLNFAKARLNPSPVQIGEPWEAAAADAPLVVIEKKKFTTAEDALAFMQAGNAIVTLVGRTSRFTYRLRESADGRVFFVSVLTGSDNTRDYAYAGIVSNGEVRQTAKSKIAADAPSWRAFVWTWDKLSRNVMPPELEIWHEGRCGRCSRVLTVPESLARGIGPDCAGRI